MFVGIYVNHLRGNHVRPPVDSRLKHGAKKRAFSTRKTLCEVSSPVLLS